MINVIFYFGVYIWFGLYFVKNYVLSEFGIGFVLIGYGLFGFLFGLVIGRLVDCFGRNYLIFVGFVIVGLLIVVFIINLLVYVVILFVIIFFLGYDMI